MTNKIIPTFTRLGIRPQFKSAKAYLKSLGDQFEPEISQANLRSLNRYVAEGEGILPEGAKIVYQGMIPSERPRFWFLSAVDDLVSLKCVFRDSAIRNAVGGFGEQWQLDWQRSIAYGYWAHRMGKQQHEIGLARDPSKQGSFLWNRQRFSHVVACIADCINLGWQDWALDLTQRVHYILNGDGYSDVSDGHNRHTQFFVLRLLADWQGWHDSKYPKWAFDEPLFNALIEHWHTPNADDIAPLLLAACDRHTHQSRYTEMDSAYDIGDSRYFYDPFEILAVLKLRELIGLKNPVLDHPIMNTPLGKLPAPSTPYTDELLEGILARARLTYPDC